MSKRIIKITDLYLNPMSQGATAPIVSPGSQTLFVGSIPVLQMTDAINPFPDMGVPLANTVFHNGLPLLGENDLTSTGGSFVLGTINVNIG